MSNLAALVRKFDKPPQSSSYLVELLLGRGLEISETKKAEKILETIGYYRLTGYMYPFQVPDGSHKFKDSIHFDLVFDHYLFDKKLRLIITDLCERIEVALKASICNEMAMAFGAHWYLDPLHFNRTDLHTELLDSISKYCKEAHEEFIKRYKSNYNDPAFPPAWMIFETLSFGALTSLYANLKDTKEKKAVASKFGIVPPILESWMRSIQFIRNCCAHHSRVWNRKIPIKPILPKREKFKVLNTVDEDTNKRIYGILSCMLYILKNINPGSKLKLRIKSLIKDHPLVNARHMGFPDGYEDEVIWKS